MGKGTIKASEALKTVSVISRFSLSIRDENLVSNCEPPLCGMTENVPLERGLMAFRFLNLKQSIQFYYIAS